LTPADRAHWANRERAFQDSLSNDRRLRRVLIIDRIPHAATRGEAVRVIRDLLPNLRATDIEFKWSTSSDQYAWRANNRNKHAGVLFLVFKERPTAQNAFEVFTAGQGLTIRDVRVNIRKGGRVAVGL
jgi:hypothetical protein